MPGPDPLFIHELRCLANPRPFQDILLEGLRQANLTDDAAAELFGVSIPTVDRWSRGLTEPHDGFKKSVYRDLYKRLTQ